MNPLPSLRPVMVPCSFCHRPVEQEELSALRHPAFVCPKVPPEIREQAKQQPGVLIVQQTPEELAKRAHFDALKQASRDRSKARQRAAKIAQAKGRG